jgi:uncharacterized membrane protein YfcA
MGARSLRRDRIIRSTPILLEGNAAVSVSLLVLLVLAIFVGAFVQGATGLGFALIAAPAVGLIDSRMLPALILTLMIPLNSFVAWREWRAIDIRGATWVMAGRVAGTAGGIWLLFAIPSDSLSLLVGFSTIAAAVASLTIPAFQPCRRTLLAVGAITGITETATGIGGPPLALAYQHRPISELRSTLAVCFLLGEVISLLMLAISRKVDWEQVRFAVYLVPIVAVGVLLSTVVHRGLDGPLVRKLIILFAIVSGIAVILHGQ